MLSNILEHHGRANQRLAFLEEDLAHAKLEEEKLKVTIETLEKEKSEMNARVALMERKDLYNLLEAKMEGFQIANHLGTIGGFKNLNLIITKKWVEIPTLNLEEFKKCPADYSEYALPLVKGLDADDFSVDKFFGLQDPTTPDDAQASPDFEEDLRTNERVRLRVEVRNLLAEPQWLTRSTRIRLEYESTILPDVAPTDNPTRPVTLDLTVDAREDPSSLPQSQLVPVPAFVDLTQYTSSGRMRDRKIKDGLSSMTRICKGTFQRGSSCLFMAHWSLAIIRIHNDVAMLAHLDSFRGTHDPNAIFHIFKTVLCLIVSIDPALVMTGIMNVEQQQQDGHSCGKHILQMLAGAAKESDGLDRCFREEGLIRYIATLDHVRSFEVLFPMYLSGKMAGPPM
ncbi:hypothetical protein R1flu_008552 [Riccia fluitans]|uniref:Uncharacterized protein n=1 Tax=Riccia fluitans TaxID=41844 RepID=A0ABD1YF52_9MARC